MRYLLDTSALVDGARPAEHPRLAAWLAAQADADLAISALTLGELAHVVERLPPGRPRERMAEWLARDLPAQFEGRVLPVDARVAAAWGRLRAAGDAAGRPLPVVDGLLLATALVHGLTVVGRSGQLGGRGVEVVEPY